MGWMQRRLDEFNEARYFYQVGCEVLGPPSTTVGLKGSVERADRMAAGRKEHIRRQVLLDRLEHEQANPTGRPSRENGYYSQDRGYGAADLFVGKDGKPTSERPHVHVIHNPREGQITIQGTLRDGTHVGKETLSIDAPGNEVNATVDKIRQLLD